MTNEGRFVISSRSFAITGSSESMPAILAHASVSQNDGVKKAIRELARHEP